MEAGSQAVLNTFTEHDYKDASNGRSAGNGAYACMGPTSRVTVATTPKVSFYPDGITSPENEGSSENLHK
jgi:hypothetical protein